MTRSFTRSVPARALLALSLLAGVAGAEPSSTRAGRAQVYSQLREDSLEDVTPPERILAVTRGNVAPTEIWRALEHGERVECLSCIPAVSRLLYVEEPKTREIAAWWLRRRVFGVFGAGQIYPRLLETVASDASEVRRARAAEAVGEFLAAAGVPVVARAAVTDSSALVRAASVRALERLNSEGPAGELGAALADASPEVRRAALHAAGRVHVFTGVDLVAGRLSDSDASVRRGAAELLGALRARDAVLGLAALADPSVEADARVRAAAVASLGQIASAEGRDAVQGALGDPDPLVQSVARVALRRL